MTERTNEQWLADLRAEGERRSSALEALRARLERGMFYFLRNDRSDLLARSSDDLHHKAQDFVQDALLKVLENLDTFRGESQFTTWAAKITTRLAISELRRIRYRDYSLEGITVDGEIQPAVTPLAISPAESLSPERHVERDSVVALVQNALENVLTERQRTALVALAIEGMPVEEIAHRMGTNRNALYKLVHDARMKLKTHLQNEGIALDYVLGLFSE